MSGFVPLRPGAIALLKGSTNYSSLMINPSKLYVVLICTVIFALAGFLPALFIIFLFHEMTAEERLMIIFILTGSFALFGFIRGLFEIRFLSSLLKSLIRFLKKIS